MEDAMGEAIVPVPEDRVGHQVWGWLCEACGVTDVATDGVVPAVAVRETPSGELVPILTLEAVDGHAEHVTLGWDNLERLADQIIVAQLEDPERGPAMLALMTDRQRMHAAADLARARAERRGTR